jgi:hypothetical protein
MRGWVGTQPHSGNDEGSVAHPLKLKFSYHPTTDTSPPVGARVEWSGRVGLYGRPPLRLVFTYHPTTDIERSVE